MNLHRYQSALMRSSKRYLTAVSGVGGGKTTLGLLWLLREASGIDDFAGIIAAPTYRVLKQSLMPKISEIAPALHSRVQRTDMTIDLGGLAIDVGGQLRTLSGRIYLRALDNPASVEGIQAHRIWLDEAAGVSQEAMMILRSRIDQRRGRMLITTTPPIGRGWLYNDYVQIASSNSDYCAARWQSIANPAFDKSAFEQARGALPDDIFRRRYCGKFTSHEGLLYEEFDRGIHELPLPDLSGAYYFGCMDFGWSNVSAYLRLASVPGKNKRIEYWVVGEHYRGGLLFDAHAEAVRKLGYVHDIIADPEDPQAISELSGKGLPIYAYSHKLSESVRRERVRSLFKCGLLSIGKNCAPNLCRELESAHYPSASSGQVKEGKVIGANHAIDALEYGLNSQDISVDIFPVRPPEAPLRVPEDQEDIGDDWVALAGVRPVFHVKNSC